MTDIFAAIDAAVGCQQCGGPLGDSPSDDFCTAEHQQEWNAARADPLVGYREPWHRPWDFPGVGCDAASTALEGGQASVTEATHLPWRVLSSNESGHAVRVEWRDPQVPIACQLADAYEALVQASRLSWGQPVRAEPPEPESALPDGEERPGFVRWFSGIELRDEVHQWSCTTRASWADSSEPEDAEVDPRERALQARRTRNTGPAVHRRPPRRIDARGVYR